MFKWMKDLDRLLRGEATRLETLRGARDGSVDIPVAGLIVVIVLLGAFYGVCMGVYAILLDDPRYLRLLTTALKVPALFLLTLAVTFPSLYVFNALVGSRLTMGSTLKLLIASLAVMLAVLASIGPIVAFFSLSTDENGYTFIKLLNVLVFAISGFLGLGFLLQTLHRLSVAQAPPPPPAAPPPPPLPPVQGSDSPDTMQPTEAEPVPYARPSGALDRMEGQVLGRHVKLIFRIWIVVFGLVGAQMAWIMRPFIGHPADKRFVLFRERGESNFFQAVWEALVNLFGGGS